MDILVAVITTLSSGMMASGFDKFLLMFLRNLQLLSSSPSKLNKEAACFSENYYICKRLEVHGTYGAAFMSFLFKDSKQQHCTCPLLIPQIAAQPNTATYCSTYYCCVSLTFLEHDQIILLATRCLQPENQSSTILKY
jgi:hypothetical protein